MTFDFFEGEEPKKRDDQDVAQQLERSLDFWATGKEDYPPAIRGVVAMIEDLREDVQTIIQKIGRDKTNPNVRLNKLVWFEDKNGKLDEACEEAKQAFRPYPVNEEGLINWQDPNNPLMEKPTRHRIVVSDHFAETNYNQPDPDAMILDDDDDDGLEEKAIGPKNWRRKITQTLKPWSAKQGDKVGYVRQADDLMIAMNTLFSRTKHGWLSVDLFKLKKRRGSVMTYAKTYEYQKVQKKQGFEFLIEFFGAAAEYRPRLGKRLSNLSTLFLEISEEGKVYVNKVSANPETKEGSAAKSVVIPLQARVVMENGMPSQLVLNETGQYFEAKLKPLIEQGKRLTTKIDLSKSSTSEKSFQFDLQLELNSPFIAASSGNAIIFQLNDMLTRFANTNLMRIRAAANKNVRENN